MKKRSAAQLERLLSHLEPGSPGIDDVSRALSERRREDRRRARMKWGKLALALVFACSLLVLWKFRYLVLSLGP